MKPVIRIRGNRHWSFHDQEWKWDERWYSNGEVVKIGYNISESWLNLEEIEMTREQWTDTILQGLAYILMVGLFVWLAVAYHTM